ncbi:MAG: amino acid transporter [Alphaproteobacteria bacterium]|jgi:L-lysine exporter family protein LysE/ArgO|nr:amino acid transporter [Alphaproteobacteria bacterium]MBP7729259.1 amino acid transporter [Alphaproteobacteria bacterium]
MKEFYIAPFIEGCGTGAGLIIAIGAQNAFVLKQGILKNYIFITVFICALIDALLICVGVGGFGTILTSNMFLLTTARWGGAAFLFYYGFRSFRSVFKTESLHLEASREPPNLKVTLTTILALSLLNPHVYLDTVVLLGSIGAQFCLSERPFFALGAIFASFIWFFGLGYGASYLRPFFQKPLSWKILDFLIGCVMWAIALSLVLWTGEYVIIPTK